VAVPIPLARRIARFNQRVTNPILGPITWYLPSFGRIEHVGRTTGRPYSAPMMAFRSRDGRRFTFALTYGPEANWVQNALAAGEVTFVSRWSGRVRLTGIRVIHDPRRSAMPPVIRTVLGVLRVDDFLEGALETDPAT
jgi:deazaflavin-dependent oxidoreductase (nitroreductase family)